MKVVPNDFQYTMSASSFFKTIVISRGSNVHCHFFIAAGIGAIKLGTKGLNHSGLPFTEEIRIIGRPVKIIGVICIPLGIGIFELGVLILIAKFSR